MFRFKQFRIQQDRCAMKIGTDGVLLGAWVNCKNAKRILDVGTGTALIALMLAQRNTQATIDAVEIDPESAAQAHENVMASLWHNRIQVICDSFQHYAAQSTHSYDLIVSNPPFFINSLKSPHSAKNTARHTDKLPFDELLAAAKARLTPTGHLAIILPKDESLIIENLAKETGFYCVEKVSVYPTPLSSVKRYLLCFGLQENSCKESDLIIEEARHSYSTQFKALTRDFYLNIT